MVVDAAAAVASGFVDLRTRSSPSKAGKEESEVASETSSFHSSDTSSDRREIEIVASALSARSEEYRLLFRLPSDEVLVQDFNCALQENILLQGHMYLFIHHICFYSNIFGFETKKTIPFNEITCVRKAKTAAIFHNAIEITAGVKKHFFGSFLSRDEAYRLIIDGWAQHASDAKALLDRQEVKSENLNLHSTSIVDTSNQSKIDPSSVERSSDADITEECAPLSNGKCEPKEPSGINDIREDINSASSSSTSMWLCEDVDAPKIPGHFTLVAEGKFPMRVEEFFDLFLSNSAVDFLETYHKKCGDKDIQITPWREHGNRGLTRDIAFLHPIKIYLGAKFSRCQEVQFLHVYRNRHLVVESSKQVSDVLYADYFKVEGIFDVEQDGNDESVLKVCIYSNVAFSKKTMFRGTIEQSTKEECRDIYTIFIKNAHDFFEQKSGQIEEISGQNVNLVSEVSGVDVDSTEGLSSELHPILPISSPEVSHDSGNNNTQFDRPRGEGMGFFMSLLSSFMELWASFCSSLKTCNNLPLILVVSVFAAILLMQASIIVLLTRTPEVHFVSQDNYMGRYVVPDNIHWLEKHLNLLKEEMVMVEIRMKKMHLEYRSLKAHMDLLERLNASHEPS